MHGGDAADILAVYALAEKLGKFAHEVLEMPAAEMQGWLAYYHHQHRVRQSNG